MRDLRIAVLLAALLAPPAALAQAAAAPRLPQAAPDTASPAQAAADTAAPRPVGAPVVVRGDTVLYVPSRFGSFTAEERAAAIAERVRRLARASDTIQVVPAESATDLVVGDIVLMTVTDADAVVAGKPRDALVTEFRAALAGEMRRVSLTATVKTIAFGTLWTALATAVLVALLMLLNRLFPRMYARIEAARRTRMPAVRIQKLELVSADTLTDLVLGAARLLRIVIVVVLLYFYLPLVLSFFPWTQRLSGSLVGYVTSPLLQVAEGFLGFLPNVFFIAVIVVVTRYVLKAIHLLFGAVTRGTVTVAGFDREWAEPTYKIVRFLVMAFAVVVLFPYLPGAKSDAFKGVSLFLGVLFSLGSSSAIANVVAGVVLTYTRAFNVGDRIQMGETTGDVVAKSLLVTRVRTIKNVDITIPNAMVLGSHILNYSAMAKVDGLILHTGVTIGYDAPWKRIHELLIAAAKATPGILERPEPFVLQTSLDDFYVSYQVNAYTDVPAVMARTYSLLHENIQDRFNEAGVEIMSPHYGSLRDGNMTTVPAGYLPKTYAAPPFQVRRVDGGQG